MHYLDYAGIYVQGCPRGSRGGGSGIGRSRGVCGLSSFFPLKLVKMCFGITCGKIILRTPPKKNLNPPICCDRLELTRFNDMIYKPFSFSIIKKSKIYVSLKMSLPIFDFNKEEITKNTKAFYVKTSVLYFSNATFRSM